MIIQILLSLGILLMIYGIAVGFKLLTQIKSKEFKIQLWATFILTCGFLLGYILYFYNIVSPNVNFVFTDTLISAIFCFGSVFVVLILTIIHDMSKKHKF